MNKTFNGILKKKKVLSSIYLYTWHHLTLMSFHRFDLNWATHLIEDMSKRIQKPDHTFMALMNLCKVSVLPAPACKLWAAGWWGTVHSVFSPDTGGGKGCLCTPGLPSWPGPGSVCWGCAPSWCSRSRESRTSARGPWRASGPGPFPERMPTDGKGKTKMSHVWIWKSQAKTSSSQAELQTLTVSQKLAIFMAFSSVSPFLA